MKKYKYIAYIQPTFKLDITDWNDEGESKDKMVRRLREELADYSVFMQNHIADYKNLEDVDVRVIRERVDDQTRST